MERNPMPMLDQSPMMMTMGRRNLVSVSHMMGSVMTPSSMSQLLRRPAWSPEKMTFQRTVMATPVVMLGE